MFATLSFCPNSRQPELQRRNATPGGKKVSAFAQRHRGRTRRMIRNDHVDSATAESAPELFAVFTLANRRAAFEFRGAVGNFLGGKRQIMRTSFRADVETRGLRCSQQRQRVCRRMVNNVDTRAELLSKFDHQGDCFGFSRARTRREKGCVVSRTDILVSRYRTDTVLCR